MHRKIGLSWVDDTGVYPMKRGNSDDDDLEGDDDYDNGDDEDG